MADLDPKVKMPIVSGCVVHGVQVEKPEEICTRTEQLPLKSLNYSARGQRTVAGDYVVSAGVELESVMARIGHVVN